VLPNHSLDSRSRLSVGGGDVRGQQQRSAGGQLAAIGRLLRDDPDVPPTPSHGASPRPGTNRQGQWCATNKEAGAMGLGRHGGRPDRRLKWTDARGYTSAAARP
jgi:hypothetical protein